MGETSRSRARGSGRGSVPAGQRELQKARRREKQLARAGAEREALRAHRSAEQREGQAWAERVEPVVPGRSAGPGLAVLHLGPTNSGKTHDALEALVAAGAGVYAAPLRQLAHEAFVRLSAQCAEGSVGLSTGEEEVNPGAQIVCATVEKAPTSGRLLVLDEAHWVTDRERGHHWTRLALTGEFEEIHLIAAPEARTLLLPLVADAAEVRTVRHRRLGELGYSGAHAPSAVPPSCLVVAFSRKSVYAVARTIETHRPGRVGVLYGALPPETRRQVIEAFTRGDLEVVVTTDVIGHGINVPASHVLFAETEKFDGTVRRELHSWEAAQIAGRAGRFGMREDGRVGVLTGLTGLAPSPTLVREATRVARGELASDLPQRPPRIRPELADLGGRDAAELTQALVHWRAWAKKAVATLGITADDVTPLVERASVLSAGELRGVAGGVGPEVVWKLVNLPVDYAPPRRTRWLDLTRATLEHLRGFQVHPGEILPAIPHGELEALEATAAAARDAQTLLRSFPGVGGLVASDAAAMEEACAREITALLPEAIRASRAGRCRSCRGSCPPWYDTCASCHRSRDLYW